MAAAAPGPGAQRLSEDNVAKASGIDTGAARAVARINTSNAETETDTVSVLAEGSAGPTKCWAPPQPGRRRKASLCAARAPPLAMRVTIPAKYAKLYRRLSLQMSTCADSCSA